MNRRRRERRQIRASFASALLALAALLALSAPTRAQTPPPPEPPPDPAPDPAPDLAPEEPEPIEGPANAESRPTPIEGPANAESRPTPIDVTVEGERAPPGSTSFGRRDIRDMPGVLGDPYRAVEVQPGVTPTASGIPYYFIRGAPPGNVGYFFDGIQVPLLFHVGGGPSVIPAAAVRRVELHPGPYPVRVGRFAGAVVEAESAPPAYTWRGEGAIRGADLGGLVEGPVGETGTALVGGHYAAGALLISAIVPSVDLSYADYQARLTRRIGPDERISLFAFGAYDYLAAITQQDGKDDTNVLMNTDFHRVDLRYDRAADTGDKLAAALTFGLDQSRDVGVLRARDWKLAARMSVARPLQGGRALLRGGLDAALDGYQVVPRTKPCEGGCFPGSTGNEPAEGQLVDAFRELFPSRIDLALGVWADALLVLDAPSTRVGTPHSRVPQSTINPGLRIDHYASLGETALAVDPRLVGRFAVTDHVKLVPAIGVASQPPGFAPLPALQIGGLPGGLQRSLQTSFGAEISLGPIEAVTSIFRQATFNLTDPIGTGRGTSLGSERFLTRSLGDAYGLELGARGALRRDLFFLVSYTLSRATRRTGGRVLPSAYDRTHIVHVALLYDLGNHWRAGVRHVLYSGFPADEAGPGREPSEHPDRVRPFYRFDVRLSKRWILGEGRYVGLVLDVQNATLSKEVFDVACDDNGCAPRELGPITLPGLALEAGF